MATEPFEFQLVPHHNILQEIEKCSRDTGDLFEKWGMKGHMQSHTFFFNKFFQPYQKEIFAQDFFKNSTVQSTLQVLTSMGQWTPLNNNSIDSVSVKEIKATLLSMNFFDKLYKAGVVHESGSIVKCFDEMIEEFLVSDELKKVVLEDANEVYSLEEKEEFLFKIFSHIVLGGPVNQYEDSVHPYLDTSKLLYKKLVSVVKDSSTNTLSVSSTVLSVKAKVGDVIVFPSTQDHTQSFCYLIIDNMKRHVTVWYHVWA